MQERKKDKTGNQILALTVRLLRREKERFLQDGSPGTPGGSSRKEKEEDPETGLWRRIRRRFSRKSGQE